MAYQVVPQISTHARYAATTARFTGAASHCRPRCARVALAVGSSPASLFAAALAIAARGCRADRADPAAMAEPADVAIAEVSVDELDRMLAGGDCQAVDANGEATRRKLG